MPEFQASPSPNLANPTIAPHVPDGWATVLEADKRALDADASRLFSPDEISFDILQVGHDAPGHLVHASSLHCSPY